MLLLFLLSFNPTASSYTMLTVIETQWEGSEGTKITNKHGHENIESSDAAADPEKTWNVRMLKSLRATAVENEKDGLLNILYMNLFIGSLLVTVKLLDLLLCCLQTIASKCNISV